MQDSTALSRRGFLAGGAGLGALAASAAAGAAADSSAGAKGWQIGCYTRPWGKYDYRVALDAIKEAGFGYAGIMTAKGGLPISVERTLEEAAEVGEECRQRGLTIPSVYGGGIPVKDSLDAGIEGLKRLIDNCAAAGAANLMMGGAGPELHDRYYEAVAACCPYAAEKGVGMSVKPHGGTNANGAQCRATVERVGHENFRIWYDPGNIYFYSEGELDPVDDAPSVDGLVVGMCIKDYVHPKQVMVTPGEGQVRFPAVMDRLKAGGFIQGPLIIECLSEGDLPHLLAEARKARVFVEELVGTGG